MKLIWSPETASKAYIDTVKSVSTMQCESSVAELVSAMAAGWNAQVVVETWSRGGVIATSIGLAVATHHSGGRHVCVVPDEESRAEYVDAMARSGRVADEVVVEEVMGGLEGVDFLVVDWRDEFVRTVEVAKLGEGGAVLICKNAASDFSWRAMLRGESRIVRSVFLPIGDKGVGIAHVGGSSARKKGPSRWIKGIDQQSGRKLCFEDDSH